MNQPTTDPDAALEPLLDDAIVHRLARSRSWINEDDNQFNPIAFKRRPAESGLSVQIAATCPLEESITKLNKCYGVAELQVGGIRALALEVQPDTPKHANILGVPTADEDEAMSAYIADKLAELSTIIWKP